MGPGLGVEKCLRQVAQLVAAVPYGTCSTTLVQPAMHQPVGTQHECAHRHLSSELHNQAYEYALPCERFQGGKTRLPVGHGWCRPSLGRAAYMSRLALCHE